MRIYNKLTLLFLKYLPVALLYTCVAKIALLYVQEYTVVKHINVVLNILIAIGLFFVSYSFKFCRAYRGILGLVLFGYINYEVYLAFNIPYNNIFSQLYLFVYMITCIWYTVHYRTKCKLKNKNKK